MSVFATSDILDAHVTLLGSLSFSPKVVQEHDFSYYVESPDILTAILPAVWVNVEDPVLIETGALPVHGRAWTDVGGFDAATLVTTRVLCAFEWSEGSEYVDQKISKLEEIADLFVGATGAAYTMGGASLTGIDLFQTVPTAMEISPPEQASLSQNEHSPLAVVALTVLTKTLAQR